MASAVVVLHEDCDPVEADDRTLPYTAYLVSYLKEGKVTYDVTICNKRVDLFDHYYDKYKGDFIRFDQTEGRVSPKLWNAGKKK